MLTGAHRHALELVCERLGAAHLDWATSGSAALALQGVPVGCADLDLATTADGASAVERALAGRVIQPVAYRTRGAIRGHLGRVELAGVEVEVLGDIQNLLPDGTWTRPPALREHITNVRLDEQVVPVLDLRHLRAAYSAMGRADTVRLIDATLAQQPGSQAVVRIAGAGDARSIARLRSEWTDEHREDHGFERRLAEWLAAEGARRTIWLAEARMRPVGMVSLVEYRRMPRPGRPDSRWGYIGHMFVSEGHRNEGIGTRLLTELIAAAEERSYARLVLAPSARAVPFFERAGFVTADDASGELLLVRSMAPGGRVE